MRCAFRSEPTDPDHRRLIEGEDRDLRAQMGARLRRLREKPGLSQQQVSERSGVAQESLSRLENGRRDPRLETLRKLARAMDMTLPELLQSLSSSPGLRAYPGRDVRAGRSWTERGGHETVPS